MLAAAVSSMSSSAADPPPFVPPAGFEPAPSAVDGIDVWAPLPPDPSGPTSTRCDHCGGTMAFSPEAGALVCGFCAHRVDREPEAAPDGHDFTLQALRHAAHGWGVDRKVLHCSGCGADLHVDAGALSVSCPFCASNEVGLGAASESALRPSHVLPFALDADGLAKNVRLWLGRGWLHPRSLQQLARLDGFVGIYLPYWAFDADARASWEGEVGEDRIVWEVDGKGRRRSRTETTWRWRSGHVDTQARGVLVPGGQRVSKRLMGRVQDAFDLDGLRGFGPDLLAGFGAQSFEIGLPEAWEMGKQEVRERARQACRAAAGGDRVRNFRVQAELHDEAWRYVLLPVWLTAYRYGDRSWQVVVDARSGRVAGQKPVVWARVWAVSALLVSLPVCTGLVGIPLLFVAGVGAFVLGFALVLLIVVIIAVARLYRHAADLEAA